MKEILAPENLCRLVLLAVLLGCAAWDLKSRRIPNALLLAGALLWLGFHILSPWAGLLRAFVTFAICLLCRAALKNALGLGDVKLLILLALFLPPAELITSLLLSFLAAAAWALLRRKKHLPLAPFLLLGAAPVVILEILF